jgi:hypothetical protein
MGEVVNAIVLTKGAGKLGSLRFETCACAGQLVAQRRTPGLFGQDDGTKI